MVSSGDCPGEGFGSFRKVPSVIGDGEGLGRDLGGSWKDLGGSWGLWMGLGDGNPGVSRHPRMEVACVVFSRSCPFLLVHYVPQVDEML